MINKTRDPTQTPVNQTCDPGVTFKGFTMTEPVAMLLYCPSCQFHHVDKPDPDSGWMNPPHATHTCMRCGLNWRPSNVFTEGVASLPATEQKHLERMKNCDPGLFAEIAAERTAERKFADAVESIVWRYLTDLDDSNKTPQQRILEAVQRLADAADAESAPSDAPSVALPYGVEYRRLNGVQWTLMAAFDHEGPAQKYCAAHVRGIIWEYRVKKFL